jgi:hypothetical protein
VLLMALLGAACDVRVDENGIRGMRVAAGSDGVGAGPDVLGAADGAQVEVRAEREVRANSDEAARDLLRTLQIREEVSADAVRISAAGEESDWHPPGLGRRVQARVDYHVRVPAGLTLVFKTENGGVRLENVNGRMTATTTNGGITGSGLGGAVTAQTVNGGIRMDLSSVTGDVNLSTTNGGVRLDLPPDVKATLDVSCVNGGISIDDVFGVERPQRDARRVNATVNGGGSKISAASVNGGIRIRARGARD